MIFRAVRLFFKKYFSRASTLGALLLLLFFAFAVGLFAGTNIQQPLTMSEPTHTLLSKLEAVDQTLANIPDDPYSVTDKLSELRAKAQATNGIIGDDAKGEIAGKSRAALEKYSQSLLDNINDLENTFGRHVTSYTKDVVQRRHEIHTFKENLETQAKAANGWWIDFYDQTRRFLKWIGPTVFGSIMLILAFALLLLHPVVKRFALKSGTFSVAGFTFAWNDINALRDDLRDRYKMLDKEISATYLQNLQNKSMEMAFAAVKADLDKAILDIGKVDISKEEHRATLYVPGFTGDELLQATGYLGHKVSIKRYLAGRRFSVRYGMIGKAWRLRYAQYNPSVENQDKNLIRNFGLTQSEAEKILPQHRATKQSLMTFAIRDPNAGGDSDPLGVIYLEAKKEDGFSDRTVDVLIKDAPGRIDGMSVGDVLAQEIWEHVLRQDSAAELIKKLVELRGEFHWDDKIALTEGQ